MGPVKRVLLGSAAGVFAVAGAQAADLPVKAKPVEYVKVCSLYGAGFWYVPGTDTCIKVGAYTKIEFNYGADGGGGPIGNNAGTGGLYTRTNTSMFTARNRNDVSFDMRQQTEYGTLRSYIDVGSQIQTSGGSGGSSVANASTIYVTRAFFQFAGFTGGRMRSFFDMYFQGNFAFASQRFNGDSTPNGILGLAYTWQFGGGVSASFSLEDGGFGTGGHGRSTVNLNGIPANNSPASLLNTGVVDVKGAQAPDFVFNLRVDQAWGFAGISAALHDASGGYYSCLGGATGNTTPQPCPWNSTTATSNLAVSNTTAAGHPADKWGGALAAAFTLTSPFGLQGDTLGAMAVYSRGAMGYATSNLGSNVFYKSGNQVSLGFASEAVYGINTVTGIPSSVELTDVWTFNGAYEHRWNPQWRTSIYGGVGGVIFNTNAKNLICADPSRPLGFAGSGTTGGTFVGVSGGVFTGNVSNCNPNFTASQLGSRTLWNPVPDVDIGFDLSWYHNNTAFAGTASLPLTASRPAGTYAITNADVLAAFFRFQRNFLY